MKRSFLRTMLALGALLTFASLATAQQSEIEAAFHELLETDTPQTIKFDVTTAAYRGQDSLEEMPVPRPPKAGDTSTESSESDADTNSHGGCDQDPDGERCKNSSCSNHCNSCNACGSCSCDCLCGGCSSECSCSGCSSDWYHDGCGSECCSRTCSVESCCESCPSDCEACGCDDPCGDCFGNEMGCGIYYAEVQNMFMRAHVNNDVIGKLREKYEYSPRIVLGYEAPSGVGGRVRYWNYTRTTSTTSDLNSLRFDFDVIDVEGTSRFSSKRADLVLSGGLRWADMTINEDGSNKVDAEMPGITFAADVRAAFGSQWAGVCGARWSMLGGDWGVYANNNFIEATRDDNVNVQEIYGGFEYRRHQRGGDVYARFVFEVQNWHSDALGANADTDTFSFVGPGIHAGASF